MFSFAPSPIWPPPCILQNGRHETGLRLYLSATSSESMKTIHFWKAFSISNPKNIVFICLESNMAAMLHFTKWPPLSRFSLISQRHFAGKYENYAFLESL